MISWLIFWSLAAGLTAAVLLYTLAPLARAGQMRAAYGVCAFIAAITLALYSWLGNSDLPPQPAGPRQEAQRQALAQVEAGAARLRQTLQAEPNDPAGWTLLASSETALGHEEAAALAFARAASLSEGEAKDDLTRQAAAARLAARYKAGREGWLTGDRAQMESNWRPLLDELPDGAPIRAEILQKLDAPQ